jgi:hypothetical protein
MEIFSPKRFTALAGSYGLRPGVAIDLEEMKPDGQERWNLDLEEDRNLMHQIIDDEEPELVTGSPPCEALVSSSIFQIARETHW